MFINAENEIDDLKDSFHEELDCVFDKFPEHGMKILLGYFNANVCREDVFKMKIGNESLHEFGNDNGVGAVNVATSKNLTVKSTVFPLHNIQKYTKMSLVGKTHNRIDHILVDRRRQSNVLDV
jgi:hypothetical protein